MPENIDHYLLAVCNPLSLAVAESIGLSQNGKGQLMDKRREGSRQYMLIFVSSVDGQILSYRWATEQDARELEDASFKAIINH